MQHSTSTEKLCTIITEDDWERAHRTASAASQASLPETRRRRYENDMNKQQGAKQNRRRRVRPHPATEQGWTCTGGYSADVFWPRLQDLNVVAGGIRSAVLLDTRRAPRASPPLADVLGALQSDLAADGRENNGRGSYIASLGLLLVDGSCFLVNRHMLRARLAEILTEHPYTSIETAAAAATVAAPTRTADKHARQPASATDSTADAPLEGLAGKNGRDVLAPTPTEEPNGMKYATTVTSSATHTDSNSACSSSCLRGMLRDRLDFAMLDVRRSLAKPCLCTDVLAPQLFSALQIMFGRHTSSVAGIEASPIGVVNLHFHSSATAVLTPSSRAPQGAPSEGELWLRDWERKQLLVDSDADSDGSRVCLRANLGDVGLPGLAGWLLEYPVIYCCRGQSADGSTRNAGSMGKNATAVEAAGGSGNCLSMAPLTVYSLGVDMGQTNAYPAPSVPTTGSSTTLDVECCMFEAFSFSVPESVDGDSDCHSSDACSKHLSDLVDAFVERVEGRIIRWREVTDCCGYQRPQKHQQLVRPSSAMSVRPETLDRVAL